VVQGAFSPLEQRLAQLQRLCGVKPPQLQLDVAGNAYEDCSSRDAVGSWDAGEDSRSMLEYVGALEGSNIWMYEMVAATGSLESQVAGAQLESKSFAVFLWVFVILPIPLEQSLPFNFSLPAFVFQSRMQATQALAT